MDTLRDVLKTDSISNVSNRLGLCVGTVRRWLELKSVPSQYTFDLLKMLSREIDYTSYTSKEKDQFFTPVDIAKQCLGIFLRVTGVDLSAYTCIEPSAGDGSFLKCLPPGSIGLDIEPRGDGILKQDYLSWTPPNTDAKYIVVGNPPFGLRGHLALQFINHSYPFADYVAFILPQLFESDGKGSPRKRVVGYNLIHSEKLTTSFYTPEGVDVNVNGVFQIWSKLTSNADYALETIDKSRLTVYSISNGGTIATTRNKNMIGKCDVYIPSTCFGRENMRVYESFEALPNGKGYGIVFHVDKSDMIRKAKTIDWTSVSFLSTNSAFNLRTSIIVKQFADSGSS